MSNIEKETRQSEPTPGKLADDLDITASPCHVGGSRYKHNTIRPLDPHTRAIAPAWTATSTGSRLKASNINPPPPPHFTSGSTDNTNGGRVFFGQVVEVGEILRHAYRQYGHLPISAVECLVRANWAKQRLNGEIL